MTKCRKNGCWKYVDNEYGCIDIIQRRSCAESDAYWREGILLVKDEVEL